MWPLELPCKPLQLDVTYPLELNVTIIASECGIVQLNVI